MRLAFAIFVALILYTPCSAKSQGLFDFLDPCIGAKELYWQERNAVLSNTNFQIDAVNSAVPTNNFRIWWWNDKKLSLINYFNSDIWPMLAAAGANNHEAAFSIWLNKEIANSGGIPKLEQLMTQEFRRLRRLFLLSQRGADMAELDEERRRLYGSCPQDVASQVFRGFQVLVGYPVGVVSRNWEMARRERGEIARAVAASTGISTRDIQRYGPLGGQNSEARKLCNGLAGIVGGRC